MARGIVSRISGTTLWRWLSQDALRPWRHRSWIYPRDPQFARRAITFCALTRRPAFGLGGAYIARCRPPRSPDLCRARIRACRRVGLPRRLGRASRQAVRPLRTQERHHCLRAPCRSGHEPGAISLRQPCVLHRRSTARSIAGSGRLPDCVAKHRSGSHTNSCQASDFDHRSALKRGLIAFQRRYQRSAKPFKWTFTRRDLRVVLVKLMSHNVTPHSDATARPTRARLRIAS